MARYCGNCGTEVDDTAVFCPTCGQPIDEGSAEMPAAPAWPDPAEDERSRPAEAPDAREASAAAQPPGERERERREEPEPADVPTRVEQRPPPPPERAAPAEQPREAPPPPATAQPPSERPGTGPQVDLPITTPVTLTGWLIGIGSLLAVLGLLVSLVVGVLNAIDLLLLLAMLGVAATVWFSAQLGAVRHARLITLVVTLIAFGIALDRIALGRAGAGELLLFLGSAAAAMGAILLELGQDQPLGGPQ